MGFSPLAPEGPKGEADSMTDMLDAIAKRSSRDGAAQLAPGAIFRSSGEMEVVEHCAWEKITLGTNESRTRIGLDGDRIWIGPRFGRNLPGCITCFRFRLAENHPKRREWDTFFGLQRSSGATTFPVVEPLSVLVEALAQELQNAGPDLRPYFILDCAEATVSRHQFFPEPGCPDCDARVEDSAIAAVLELSPRLRELRDGGRVANPKLSLTALRTHFVDFRSGLIKHVYQDLSSQLMPMSGAEAVIIPGEAESIGYGRAGSVAASEKVAILESLERFANTRPRGKATAVRASYRDLGPKAVDPRMFILHDQVQGDEPGYALETFDDTLEHNWVWGFSFRTRSPVLIPEQLSYFGVASKPDAPLNRYVQHTSSGCALGGSIEEAVLFGLFEIIERDCYMTGWYGRFAYPALDCSDAKDPLIGRLIARAEAEGYRIHLFDMTLESEVPSIWAMVEDPRAGAPVASYCAAATHLDPEKAIVSALVEVISSIAVYRRSMPPLRDRARALLADPSLVQDMSDHVLLYSQPETLEWLNFLRRDEAKVPLSSRFAKWYAEGSDIDLTKDLELIVDRLLGVAFDVIVVDQSFAALRPLSLHAAQVSVPGLAPVTFGHQYRRVSRARIACAGEWLGLEPDLSMVDRFPHNFP